MKIVLLIAIFFISILNANISLPNSFKADFKQTVTNQKRQKIEYSGNLLFSKPNSLKWIYLTPTKKDVCTDDTDLIVVDYDLEQVSRYILDDKFNLPAIIGSASKHKNNLYIAKYNEKDYTIEVDNKNRLKKVLYYDDLENLVVIEFLNIKYSNKAINKQRLECKIPKSYDLL
jgi:hypothetical protein